MGQFLRNRRFCPVCQRVLTTSEKGQECRNKKQCERRAEKKGLMTPKKE